MAGVRNCDYRYRLLIAKFLLGGSGVWRGRERGNHALGGGVGGRISHQGKKESKVKNAKGGYACEECEMPDYLS